MEMCSTNIIIIELFLIINRKNRLVRLINPATVRRKKARLERRLSYIDSLTAVPYLTLVSIAPVTRHMTTLSLSNRLIICDREYVKDIFELWTFLSSLQLLALLEQ